MKKLATLFLILFATCGMCQTMSYWAQGFNRQGNAQLAQEYFFREGPGIVITFTNPYVYISVSPAYIHNIVTNGGSGPWTLLGNDIFWTRPVGQAWIGDSVTTNWIVDVSGNGYYRGLVHANGFSSVKDIIAGGFFVGDASYLTNFPGLSVTQSLMLVSGGTTNLYTNVYSGGLLVASGPAAAHGSSLLLPSGGYLLQPNGGTFLLP